MPGQPRKRIEGLRGPCGTGRCIAGNGRAGGTADGGNAGGEENSLPACCPIVIHVLATATLKGPPVAWAVASLCARAPCGLGKKL